MLAGDTVRIAHMPITTIPLSRGRNAVRHIE